MALLLNPAGRWLINGDDPRLVSRQVLPEFAAMTFGVSRGCDFRELTFRRDGPIGFRSRFNLTGDRASADPASWASTGSTPCWLPSGRHLAGLTLAEAVQGSGTCGPTLRECSRFCFLPATILIRDEYNGSVESYGRRVQLLEELAQEGRSS